MIPDRLTANGFVALIRQWRDMWNNQLRDHLHRSRIVAGTGIRVQHTASGTIVSALKASGGGVNAPVETSGELIIGVVVSATPQGGPATIAEITLNADGTFQETGVQHQVIIPRV